MLSRRLAALFLAMAALFSIAARAADALDTIPVDLATLIRDAASNAEQFAINVPHAVSTSAQGTWSDDGTRATWTYGARIPTVISMSFHASRLRLPPSAVLTVRGVSSTTTYRAADTNGGEFWSRLQLGDTLEFTLEVASAERAQTALDILSFQAGYKSLAPGVRSHALYDRVRAQAAADPNYPCVENYSCHATASNDAPSKATVALLIGNLYQCTGTLINNTSQDGTPYVLTARHCQNGNYGGGDPSAASKVTVYWNAQDACGLELGTVFYSSNAVRQTGASTVVEQEDLWLILLDVSPITAGARFAGFDAVGGAIIGGYTVHHARSYDKQYTGWFGEAYVSTRTGVLGATFTSHLLETVNSIGMIAPGASGSALFDQNDRLVGSLSLGRQADSLTGLGSCPSQLPAPPNGSNGEAAFTSLAALWTSISDPTSTTGSATLKSVLDPGNTGAFTVASRTVSGVLSLNIFGETRVDTAVQVQWTATGASTCTASGGVSGDGWAGTVGTSSGSRMITVHAVGDAVYVLRCTYPDGSAIVARRKVTWQEASARVLLLAERSSVWTNRPVTLTWSSNVTPCSLSGGSLSLTGQPATGSVDVTQSTAGDVTYQLTCGSLTNSASFPAVITYATPSLNFTAAGSLRRVGERLVLNWSSWADTCTRSGGAPNDGWVSPAINAEGAAQLLLTNVPVGTYTYDLECVSGPVRLAKSVSVTVENAPPSLTTSVDRTSSTFSASPSDDFRMTFRSNLSSCGPTVSPFGAAIASQALLGATEGDYGFSPTQSGTFQVTVTCHSEDGSALTSPPQQFTVLPPPAPTVTIGASSTSPYLGSSVKLSWTSTNTATCNGAQSGAEFLGFGVFGVTGEWTVTPTKIGTDGFDLDCSSIDPALPRATGHVAINVQDFQVSVSSSAASVVEGQSFTLTWSSPDVTSCSAPSIPGSASALPSKGSATVNTTVGGATGTFSYAVNCSIGSVQRSGQAQVSITSAPASTGSGGGGGTTGTTSSSSGSSGGGGAFDPLALGMLIGLLGLRWRKRPLDSIRGVP